MEEGWILAECHRDGVYHGGPGGHAKMQGRVGDRNWWLGVTLCQSHCICTQEVSREQTSKETQDLP